MKQKRIAAIDVGSNTVHALVVQLRKHMPPRHLSSAGELLELGREVMLHGRLTQAKLAELKETLKGQVHAARKLGAQEVVIGATGAFRQAKNGVMAARKLSRALGVPVHILSSEREAELSFLGVRSELHERRHQLVIDSGGASTELVLCEGREARAFASLPVGGSLLASQLKNDPPLPLEWARLTVQVADALNAAPSKLTPTSVVAMGGAAHRFEEILRDTREGKPLRQKDLEKVMARLLRYPSKRIARMSGMQPRRVALLTASALILSVILNHYGLKKIEVVHLGLRDGMAMAWAQDPRNWWKGGRLRSLTRGR